jgi:hypothetical protein
MTSLPNDVIELDKIHRPHANISHLPGSPIMSTRRRDSEESLKSVIIEPVNSHNDINSRRDFVIGLVLLFVVVVIWTASNFITQVRGKLDYDSK